jgi:hypothetical protein
MDNLNLFAQNKRATSEQISERVSFVDSGFDTKLEWIKAGMKKNSTSKAIENPLIQEKKSIPSSTQKNIKVMTTPSVEIVERKPISLKAKEVSIEFKPTQEEWEQTHELLSKNYGLEIYEPNHLEPTNIGRIGQGETGANIQEKLKNADKVVLGDLHASSLKLLETLVMCEMVYLPIEQVKKFIDCVLTLQENIRILRRHSGETVPIFTAESMLMNKHGLAHNQFPEIDFEDINADNDRKNALIKYQKASEIITNEIIPSLIWTGESRSINLVGDVICDRGVDDSITLQILKEISVQAEKQGNHNPFEVVISNHDMRYLTAPEELGYNGIDYPSYGNMFLTKSKEWVKEQMEWYFSQMKMFDYDKSSDTFISHTALEVRDENGKITEFGQLKILLGYDPDANVNAKEFVEKANSYLKKIISIEFSNHKKFDPAIENMIKSLAKINPKVNEYIERHFLNNQAKGVTPVDAKILALRSWNISLIMNITQDRPLMKKDPIGVKNFIHGHDSVQYFGKDFDGNNIDIKLEKNVICLDNNARKGMTTIDSNRRNPNLYNSSMYLIKA